MDSLTCDLTYDTLLYAMLFHGDGVMRIVICDDERRFADQLRTRILELCLRHEISAEVEAFYSSVEMLQKIDAYKEEQYLVFFLDIDMPSLSGFEVVTELQKRHMQCKVVFVTNKDELVFQSFAFHPFFFLRKSHLDLELERQLLELNRLLRPNWTYLTLQEGKKIVKIPIETIECVESEKNYLLLHSDDNGVPSVYRLRMKISEAEKKWRKYGFIRAHRGFLVNFNYIDHFSMEKIVLLSGRVIPIGRNYAVDLRKKILEASDNG